MVRRIVSAILTVSLLLSVFVLFAVSSSAADEPVMDRVKAAYVSCIETGDVLFQYNPEAELFTTSSTKLMTAIVAIEELKDRIDEKITVTSEMLGEVSGNRFGLVAGETVTVNDLIHILVTGGNNDGAYCLAYLAAGSVQAFVDKMNNKAKVLGANNTHYTNPTGMHDEFMKTTVTDTAIIAKYAWSLPVFIEASSVTKYVMDATNMSDFRNIYNRNCLISKYYDASYYNENCSGLNAGSTELGGHCVITVAKNEDLSYLIIAMGGESTDEKIYSYVNVQTLIDWAFEKYAMREVLYSSKVVCEMPVELSSAVDFVTVAPDRTVKAFLETSVDVDKEIEYSWSTYEETLSAPLKAGQVVGQITATYKAPGAKDAAVLGSCDLVVTSDVERSEFLYTLSRIENLTKSKGFIAALIFAVILSVGIVFFNARKRKTRGRF